MTPVAQNLLSCFRAEATELLDTLTRGCLDLEKDGCEAGHFEELNRAAHSLKGAARLVELFDVSKLAHTLEDAFAEMSGRGAKPAKDEVTALLKSVDELKRLVEAGMASPENAPAPPPAPPPEPPRAAEPLPAAPPPVSQTDGPAPGDHPVAQPAPVVSAEPTRSPVRPVGHDLHRRAGAAEGFARVSTQTLVEIGRCASELLEVTGWMTRVGNDLATLKKLSLNMVHESDAIGDIGQSGTHGSVVRAAAQQGRWKPHGRSEFRRLAETLTHDVDRVLGAAKPLSLRLHRLALDAQTDAVGEMSPRFERIVRDAAIDLGRTVEFAVSGADVRVDRHVLQQLADPISHLLRNAVAHGVEPTDVRQARNKPAAGQVQLGFEARADALRVTVADDGAGLDSAAILRAARAAGFMEPDAHPAVANGDVAELIFRPGLTTAAQTSQVSGRGIGLDVVRRAVEQLNGTVRVESEPGRFCRFTIEVPSRVDVMNVFVLRAAGQAFLVPLASVVQTCIIKRSEIIVHGGVPALLVNEEPVRLVQLPSLLGLDAGPDKPERCQVAVLEAARQRIAVEVESLRGKWRAVIKAAGPVLALSPVVTGAAITSDGRPAFLIRPDMLIRLADTRPHAVSMASAPRPARRKGVLVVDDSLTTRMLETAVLEAAGYRVVIACNGSEALECIAREELDLAVIDFEMPGMNGLDLARGIREHTSHRDLPLIMLTSRSSDDDRRKAMASGFQAYLVKGQFEQTSFLDTVQGLIGHTESPS